MQIQELKDIKTWELIWDELKSDDAGAVLLFKLSPTCPVSHRAEDQFRKFVDPLPDSKDLRVISVNVVYDRPISQRIAEDTGIQHESPQALLLSRGRNVRWHDSHSSITQESLKQALELAKV